MIRIFAIVHLKLVRFAIALIMMGGAGEALAQSKSPLHAAIRGVDMGTYARIIMSLDELPKQDIKIPTQPILDRRSPIKK